MSRSVTPGALSESHLWLSGSVFMVSMLSDCYKGGTFIGVEYCTYLTIVLMVLFVALLRLPSMRVGAAPLSKWQA